MSIALPTTISTSSTETTYTVNFSVDDIPIPYLESVAVPGDSTYLFNGFGIGAYIYRIIDADAGMVQSGSQVGSALNNFIALSDSINGVYGVIASGGTVYTSYQEKIINPGPDATLVYFDFQNPVGSVGTYPFTAESLPLNGEGTMSFTAEITVNVAHEQTLTLVESYINESWNARLIGVTEATINFDSGSISYPPIAYDDQGGRFIPGIEIQSGLGIISFNSGTPELYASSETLLQPVIIPTAQIITYDTNNNIISDVMMNNYGNSNYGINGVQNGSYGSTAVFSANTIPVGQLIVASIPPPVLSYVGLDLITTPADTSGNYTWQQINASRLSGWRYLTVDVAVTASKGACPPQVWLSLQTGITDPYTGAKLPFSPNDELLKIELNWLIDDNAGNFGYWWRVPYDLTKINGEIQTLTIDLAHPVYYKQNAQYGFVDSYYQGLGKGLFAVSNTDAEGSRDQRDNAFEYAGLILATDSPSTTVTLSNMAAVQLKDSIIRFECSPEPTPITSTLISGFEIEQPLSLNQPYYESQWYEDGETAYTDSLTVERDHVTAASFYDQLYVEPYGYTAMTIQQFLDSMNALANGYQWSFSSAGSPNYDLSNVLLGSLLPTLVNDFPIDGRTIPLDSPLIIPLSFKQMTVTEGIWWSTVGKLYTLDQLEQTYIYRGNMFDDYSDTAFTGVFIVDMGIYDPAKNSFTPTNSFHEIVQCDSDGYYRFVSYPSNFNDAATKLTAGILAGNYSIHSKINFQYTFSLADLSAGTSTGSAIGLAPYKTLLLATQTYGALAGVRFLSPEINHSDFSFARSAMWQVGNGSDGYLRAKLLTGYVGDDYLSIQIKKILPLRGAEPFVRADSNNGNVRVTYTSSTQQPMTFITKDQFQTIESSDMIFTELAEGVGVDTCFCIDESTGQMFFFIVVPSDSIGNQEQNGTIIPPYAPLNTNDIPPVVIFAVRRYDAQGNPLPFLPNADADNLPQLQSIYQNLVYINQQPFGRPYCQVLPPHRIVFAYGGFYYYSNDSGSTWFDQSGLSQASLSNIPFDTIGGSNPADGGTAGDPIKV